MSFCHTVLLIGLLVVEVSKNELQFKRFFMMVMMVMMMMMELQRQCFESSELAFQRFSGSAAAQLRQQHHHDEQRYQVGGPIITKDTIL